MSHRFPDFLVIGAAKSGTTWLQRTLAAHPAIDMPEEEIHYFSRFHDSWPAEKYLSLFDQFNKPCVGENSNTYLSDSSVAPRVKAMIPHGKLIATLRNPIERSYSSYCMQIDRGRANRDIERYMDIDFSPLPHIITNSLYYEQLLAYFRNFQRQQIHVCLFDDIKIRPKETYAEITRFLNVTDHLPDNLVQKFNEKGRENKPASLARLTWIINHSPLAGTRALNLARQSPVRHLFSRFGSKRDYPVMPEKIKLKLRTHFRNDILKTQDLLQIDLSSWLDEKLP